MATDPHTGKGTEQQRTNHRYLHLTEQHVTEGGGCNQRNGLRQIGTDQFGGGEARVHPHHQHQHERSGPNRREPNDETAD
jgi:hypothetical protein